MVAKWLQPENIIPWYTLSLKYFDFPSSNRKLLIRGNKVKRVYQQMIATKESHDNWCKALLIDEESTFFILYICWILLFHKNACLCTYTADI
jgi:hypothetical protein